LERSDDPASSCPVCAAASPAESDVPAMSVRTRLVLELRIYMFIPFYEVAKRKWCLVPTDLRVGTRTIGTGFETTMTAE
jgi:hypothetical protein